MPADNELDPLDRWLEEQVRPLPPPSGTFELITRRARRRKARKALIAVASAAAVAAAVAVAVPAGLSLRLSPAPVKGQYAAGSSAISSGTRDLETAGARTARQPTASPASASATASAHAEPTGPVPANFDPVSVTFVSTSTAWVIGQAGTPGKCANAASPDICTSVARTDDAGKTWEGSPAPGTTGPDGASGVSGIRFLDGVNGWAFGPELWVTHDEGRTWTKIDTGGARVTDLETAGDRAYALFASCGTSTNSSLGFAYPCTSYTLMTSLADSGTWTPVGSATSGLTNDGSNTSAMIALYGSTGYLVAPDGTLYSGALGSSWQRVSTPSPACLPGIPATDGLPSRMTIALASSTEVAVACEGGLPTQSPTVWRSDDSGAAWTTAGWPSGTTGVPTSLAATSAGAVVLATTKGIWRLAGQTWTGSNVTGPGAPSGGFTYVGMTTAEQGVALPADAGLHEIWMTFNGGKTWRPATPVTPGN
jgi:hypothetical protein